MEKIIVIGSPGAGKSLFSKKLKNITKLPLYHIDMLYHKKDGTHITKEELEEKLKEMLKRQREINQKLNMDEKEKSAIIIDEEENEPDEYNAEIGEEFEWEEEVYE